MLPHTNLIPVKKKRNDRKPEKYIHWINQNLELFISEIYRLFVEIISHIDLKYPSEKIINELRDISDTYMQQHRIFRYQKNDDYYGYFG